jgi:zinc/manganese transport system permease protein
MIRILFPVFLLSLALLGIHSYFGLEIIRRGIIFTDLAIGQMAALGAAVSLSFLDGRLLYPLSLGFALFAGIGIALISKRTAHLEAFIGILYAFGLSGVFLLFSKSPQGLEVFQRFLASDILFIPLKRIVQVAFWYSVLGITIYLINHKLKGRLREILFFVTFAVTVTSSVEMVGVLVVFAILIGPASIVINLAIDRSIFTAWTIGTVINLLALLISYLFDFPTGYCLVFMHSFVALPAFFISKKTRLGPYL